MIFATTLEVMLVTGYVCIFRCLHSRSIFPLQKEYEEGTRLLPFFLVNVSDDKDNKHNPSCLSRNVLLGIDDKNDVSKY